MRPTIVFVFLFCFVVMSAQTEHNTSRENQTVILTADIDHFWEAYDQLRFCNRFQDSVNCLKNLYFDKGTKGFEAFIKKYQFTPRDYITAISEHPKYFSSIRHNTFEVKRIEKKLDLFYSRLCGYFPEYKPLKICFVMSPLQSGGTTSDGYLLIGTEIVASTKEADLSEFGTGIWAKVLAFDTNVRDRLLFVVAHETIHDLQTNADFNNYALLNKSLNEGSADFIAELFTGVRANHYLYDYGNQHEYEIWKKFKKALENNENTDNWMYNIDRVEEGVPADLGYYTGYRIAECYYKNCKDKRKAVFDIIQMKSPETFLSTSGYDGKGLPDKKNK